MAHRTIINTVIMDDEGEIIEFSDHSTPLFSFGFSCSGKTFEKVEDRYIFKHNDRAIFEPLSNYIEIDNYQGMYSISIVENSSYFNCAITPAAVNKFKTSIDILLAKLNIATAPHIGVLIEGDDITINDRNSISLTDFEDGEECVLIKHPNGNFTANGERCFVYHVDSLQGWFDAGNKSEPLTRVPITQSMLQRFNYAKPASTSAPAARKARKSRKFRKARKTRKARKNIF